MKDIDVVGQLQDAFVREPVGDTLMAVGNALQEVQALQQQNAALEKQNAELLAALQKTAATVQQFRSDWQKVPYFADRVNKATREAMSMAIGQIVNLDAVGCPLDRAALQPSTQGVSNER